ncbi:hypothetical protein HYH03_004446 [Edaphochlamys debaryana]|uniref:Uncharacterized protein n=1 Tax=Edaphochlamys debaryana TaxID=47281 RepID=A0A836C3I1_9CHLO|nr:hypothetical protein HYH03_004446 [Edaphochlamys debaryana]|eukprot:KAG2497709.1 hypothetical protein HYH03_004446 [Edaphochlamys debaryana]
MPSRVRPSRPPRRPRLPPALSPSPPLGSAAFLHASHDSLPGPGPAGAWGQAPALSPPAARAQRHQALAGQLIQFVARLPAPSPDSPAQALRSRLGARLGVHQLGAWLAEAAAALAEAAPAPAEAAAALAEAEAPSPSAAAGGGEEGARAEAAGGQAGAGAVAVEEVEARLEDMLTTQPQLLAQDPQVLAARLRGLASALGLPGPAALGLATGRPGLLLLDGPTLDRRIEGLQAAMGLPSREAAAAMAARAPAWLYSDLPLGAP